MGDIGRYRMWSRLLDREANLSNFDLMCAPASTSGKFPGGRMLGSKVVKGGKRTFIVQLPWQYRHMSVDEFIEASKRVLNRMQERLERTGRLIE
jgi:hypothetical protein